MYEANVGNGKTITRREDKYLVITIYQGVWDDVRWMTAQQAKAEWRTHLKGSIEMADEGGAANTAHWWRNASIPEEFLSCFENEKCDVHTIHVDDVQTLDEINAQRQKRLDGLNDEERR